MSPIWRKSRVRKISQIHLLLTILYAGKDLYEEIHRNLFVLECEIAERLPNDVEQFINDLLIGCRHLQRNREIMDGVYDIVDEFQRLTSRLEERFQASEECDVHYTCPKSAPEGRGRPKLLIPKEQLEGLRSLGFPWTSIYISWISIYISCIHIRHFVVKNLLRFV